MALNVTQKLLRSHLSEGKPEAGTPIGLHVDQALLQDATGTLVMLSLEALGLAAPHTETAVQYVDHNLLQQDSRNAEDHVFLRSGAARFGLIYSRPGNGVSHPLHMARFGVPGKTLLGSDSHTPAAGALGMLAFGAGGLDVAMAIAGVPYPLTMPRVWGIRLTGKMPDWVSAKDVILEMLRRHGVSGGLNRIIEYHGPGLKTLGTMDRHVIANMGTELGATSSVFPSDDRTQAFLETHGRSEDWTEIVADDSAAYDMADEIDLSQLEPLIALPSSPGNVVSVREVEGKPVHQAYIGSSANPGYRDFAVVAEMVRGRRIAAGTSLDINPTSRTLLQELADDGSLTALLASGARLHQVGCNGCIGMGQAPAKGLNSLRTVPRNFPGRSGAREDAVFLCSPETAAASILSGRITDPRRMDMPFPRIEDAGKRLAASEMFEYPPGRETGRKIELVKGGNIVSLPAFEPLPEHLELKVILRLGDDISTDEIMPAGAEALPYRSNIPKIAQFVFRDIDEDYPANAEQAAGGHMIVAGDNYGQGSSREHAALAPRYLGLRAVLAKSFARIHHQNLLNYGVLPLVADNADNDDDLDRIDSGQTIVIEGAASALRGNKDRLRLHLGGQRALEVRFELTNRERRVLLDGGLVNFHRNQA
ncbi:aconitate hydratase [Stappia sp. F7233]|uniref:Aconitate hydratase n=1 Tax=Stappia albiluteola TaxID=2758565 RepID=A0A839AFI5_9HYPH|nr:aconitate hydratase [Stappia albiluteola]MBA5777547.1 aconitate hydratase [Stappia albiluteola]